MQAISYYESQYNIPRGILHSIAMIESGRWDEKDKRVYPWPWAVNVKGEPHYFSNQTSAINFVKMKLRSGVKNIDVGCNQISLLHHGHKFPTLEHAFDPHTNSRYAAEFLQTNYNESRNWLTAIGWYHSKTLHLATPYIHKVHKTWRNLEGRNRGHASPSTPLKLAAAKPNKKHHPTSATKRNQRRQTSVIFIKH